MKTTLKDDLAKIFPSLDEEAKKELLDSKEDIHLAEADIKKFTEKYHYSLEELKEIKREILRGKDEYEILNRIRTLGFIERSWGIIGQSFKSITEEKLANMNAKDLVKIIDILIGKIRLLQNESTSISETRIKDLSDEKLEREISKLEAILGEEDEPIPKESTPKRTVSNRKRVPRKFSKS